MGGCAEVGGVSPKSSVRGTGRVRLIGKVVRGISRLPVADCPPRNVRSHSASLPRLVPRSGTRCSVFAHIPLWASPLRSPDRRARFCGVGHRTCPSVVEAGSRHSILALMDSEKFPASNKARIGGRDPESRSDRQIRGPTPQNRAQNLKIPSVDTT